MMAASPKKNRAETVCRLLLFIGVLFFAFESIIHLFGLPILEHDRIFIPTHDRYIALYALTYAVLFVLIILNTKKYRFLFHLTMIGILFAMINAIVISRSGGYDVFFHTVHLDEQLSTMGYAAVLWYLAALISWFAAGFHKQT